MKQFLSFLACGVLAATLGCSKERAQERTDQGQAPATEPSARDQAVTTNAQSAALNPDDRSFLERAAASGKAEVEFAQLAMQKAQNDQVKQLAQRIMTDHSQANTELLSMADKMQLSLPTALDKDHQEHREDLAKLSGARFDREYLKMMVDEHQRDLDDVKKQSNDAINSDVKRFAAKQVPVLQQHLDLAKALHDKQK